jgi:hypothetical protein
LKLSKPYKLLCLEKDFTIDESMVGSKLMRTETIPIYGLVPQKDIVSNSVCPNNDVKALQKI